MESPCEETRQCGFYQDQMLVVKSLLTLMEQKEGAAGGLNVKLRAVVFWVLRYVCLISMYPGVSFII